MERDGTFDKREAQVNAAARRAGLPKPPRFLVVDFPKCPKTSHSRRSSQLPPERVNGERQSLVYTLCRGRPRRISALPHATALRNASECRNRSKSALVCHSLTIR